MQHSLRVVAETIKVCKQKEELFELLDVQMNTNMSTEMRFMLAIKACDNLYKYAIDQHQDTTINVNFIGHTRQGAHHTVHNIAHFKLNDKLYLACLEKINRLYLRDLREDHDKHPAYFFKQSKKQQYDNRGDQIYYSKKINEVLSKVNKVLCHQAVSEVNPTHIFSELCSADPYKHRFTNDILQEICTRMKTVFNKKYNNEFSIFELWNINHTEQFKTNITVGN